MLQLLIYNYNSIASSIAHTLLTSTLWSSSNTFRYTEQNCLWKPKEVGVVRNKVGIGYLLDGAGRAVGDWGGELRSLRCRDVRQQALEGGSWRVREVAQEGWPRELLRVSEEHRCGRQRVPEVEGLAQAEAEVCEGAGQRGCDGGGWRTHVGVVRMTLWPDLFLFPPLGASVLEPYLKQRLHLLIY